MGEGLGDGDCVVEGVGVGDCDCVFGVGDFYDFLVDDG